MDLDEIDIDINAIPEHPGDVPECRICGGVAEDDAPLFYPCKCSGTIRYIHQECLTTWLKHSKKRSCDVCKYPYSFTKVYKEDMPDIIPVHVVVKRIFNQLLAAASVGFRAWLVVLIWLIIVPYFTVWAWRFYFWLGDQVAWNVYGPPSPNEVAPGRPNRTDTVDTLLNFYKSWLSPNVTQIDELLNTMETNPGSLNKVAEKFLDRMAADVVNGQLVTAGIVITFLATFLMREWVAQNAMPGVFGDDEAGVQEVNVAPEPIDEAVAEEQALPAGDGDGEDTDHEGEMVLDEPDEELHVPTPGEAVVPTALAAPHFPRDRELAPPAAPAHPHHAGLRENFIEGLFEEIALGQEESERAELRWELAEADTASGGLDVVLPDDPATEDGAEAVTEAEPVQDTQPKVDRPLGFAHFRTNRRWAFHPSSTWTPPAVSTAIETSSPEASSSAASSSAMAGSNSIRLADSPSDGKGSIYAAIMAKRAAIPPNLSRVLPLPRQRGSKDSASTATASDDPWVLSVVQGMEVSRSGHDSGGPRGSSVSDLRQLLMEANKLTEEFKKLKETNRMGSSPAGSWTEIDPPIGSGSEYDLEGLSHEDEQVASTATILDGPEARRSEFPSDVGLLQADDLTPMSQESLSAALDAFLRHSDRQVKQDVKGKGRAVSFGANPFADPPTDDFIPYGGFRSGPVFNQSTSRAVKQLPLRRRQVHTRKQQEPTFSTFTFNWGQPSEGPSDQSETRAQDESSRPMKIHRIPSAASGEPAWLPDTGGKATPRSPPDFQFTFTLPPKDPALRTHEAPVPEGVLATPNGSASVWLQRSNGAIPGPSRRPGLPPTTPNGGTVVDPSGGANPQAGSPGLAIYRPPEELHTDGYFPRNGALKDAVGPADGAEPQGNGDGGAQVIQPEAPPAADDFDDVNQENEDPLDLIGPPDEDDDPGEDVVPDGQNDDLEQDEELEGIMEAIGMRGAVGNVFQNALLMSVLLDLILIFGLFLPYTLGKTAALVALRPRRSIVIIKLPIRIVRVLTDPIVENAILLVRLVVAPLLLILGRRLAYLLPARTPNTGRTNDSDAEVLSHWVQKSVTRHAELLAARCRSEWHSSGFRNAAGRLATRYLEYGEPGAVARFRMGLLVKEREHAETWRHYTEVWTEHALGNEPLDRAFAVAVGYVALTVLMTVYLGVSSSSAGALRRVLRSVIRQQLIVIKVAIFIFIELVLFPLGCGAMIDFSTLPLFDSHTSQNRIAFLHHAPVTCIFTHWMIGTMFMYQFAAWLSSVRSIIRRGGMWFIKDPGDPNFHPIRDMLDRPVLTQLRKLWMSAVMYFGVIAVGAGSILLITRRTFASTTYPLFPLRWNMREPLSVIPFDLLVLSILTPVTIGKLRMRRAVLHWLSLWWPFMSRQLRLSSYMFGGRWVDEEMFDLRGPVNQWKDWLAKRPRRFSKFRGSFRRAPATDAVLFPPNTRGLVVVDEEGRPTSQQEAELAVLQDEACRKAGAAPEESFTLLYVPPFFRLRIYLFICSLWISAAAVALACFAVPIYLGRASVHLTGRAPIHDGYTWTMGVYILWASAVVWREYQWQFRKRISTPQRMLRNAAFRLFGIAYLVVTVGIMTPILLALVINFYLILPVRLDLGMSKPDIHLVDMWVLGLMYVKIGDSMSRWHPPNKHTRAFRAIMATGFRHPNVWKATADFIGPVVVGLLLMLIVPPALIFGLRVFIPALRHPDAALVYGYPALFIVSTLMACVDWLMRVLQSWVQRTRDAEFLLELRLSNLEKEVEQEREQEQEQEPKEQPIVQ